MKPRTIHGAKPSFGVGDPIAYIDKQGRPQRGEVRNVEAKWNHPNAIPLITYRVTHPTAGTGHVYITGKDFAR